MSTRVLAATLLSAFLLSTGASVAQSMYPIKVKSSNVYVRVKRFSGDFRVNGYVDKQENLFWSNVQVIGKKVILPENTKASQYIMSVFNNPQLGNKSTEWTGKILVSTPTLKEIDKWVNDKAQDDFDSLKTLVARPASGSDAHQTALKNYVHKDDNYISFEVTPLSLPWSLTLEIFTYESGTLEVIQETHLDQEIGTKSPTIRINVEDY